MGNFVKLIKEIDYKIDDKEYFIKGDSVFSNFGDCDFIDPKVIIFTEGFIEKLNNYLSVKRPELFRSIESVSTIFVGFFKPEALNSPVGYIWELINNGFNNLK